MAREDDASHDDYARQVDKIGQVHDNLTRLFNTEYDWPELQMGENLSVQTRSLRASQILGIGEQQGALHHMFDAHLSLLGRIRNLSLRVFEREFPDVDLTELNKYWNGRYPRRDALEAKAREMLDWDADPLEPPTDEELERIGEVERIHDQIQALPAREEAMQAEIRRLYLPTEAEEILVSAMQAELLREDRIGRQVKIKEFGARLTELQKLLNDGEDLVFIENKARAVAGVLKVLRKELRPLDEFAFAEMPDEPIENQRLADALRVQKDAMQLGLSNLNSILDDTDKILAPLVPKRRR